MRFVIYDCIEYEDTGPGKRKRGFDFCGSPLSSGAPTAAPRWSGSTSADDASGPAGGMFLRDRSCDGAVTGAVFTPQLSAGEGFLSLGQISAIFTGPYRVRNPVDLHYPNQWLRARIVETAQVSGAWAAWGPRPPASGVRGKPIPRSWTLWTGSRGAQGPSIRPQSGWSPRRRPGWERG